MDRNVVHSLVGVLIAQVVGQILVNREPQFLALHGNIRGLNGALIAVYDQGVDPGGRLAGEPAILSVMA